jgi:inosose dehydratase
MCQPYSRRSEKVGFPADGAMSLEYEENPQDSIAEICECVVVAKRALIGSP